ncbi:hypothetical protein D9756_009458 [Leucocoprinus leucothites]|uniref:Uncharacterized protein n=1 Tax=Leucocoprinus leucothites TaxID=201217 RepID=A0A8H5FUE7_9AGAR|nr:hypothetical protein D9756_009458 [Leucoagaricus leucothites]
MRKLRHLSGGTLLKSLFADIACSEDLLNLDTGDVLWADLALTRTNQDSTPEVLQLQPQELIADPLLRLQEPRAKMRLELDDPDTQTQRIEPFAVNISKSHSSATHCNITTPYTQKAVHQTLIPLTSHLPQRMNRSPR